MKTGKDKVVNKTTDKALIIKNYKLNTKLLKKK